MNDTKKLHQLFNKLFRRYATKKLVDSFFKPLATHVPLSETPGVWNGDVPEKEARDALKRGDCVSSFNGKYSACMDTTGMVRRITVASICDSRETSVQDYDSIEDYIVSLKQLCLETFDGVPYGVSRRSDVIRFVD